MISMRKLGKSRQRISQPPGARRRAPYLTATALSFVAAVAKAAPMYTGVDLTPAGFDWAAIGRTADGQQVGNVGGPATGGHSHALLWTDGTSRFLDLHPAGFTASVALGARGGHQVGQAYSA